MKLLNAGCGTHYAAGWVNTDVWQNEETRPDVLLKPGEPYPFEDNTFDAVLMSHVLEHIAWPEVPAFLKDMSRVAKPGAPMLIVCPDAYKAINLWHEGKLPWWIVEAVLEHQHVKPEDLGDNPWWDNAPHHWNAHEKRVEALLKDLKFVDIENVIHEIPKNNSWKDKYIPDLIWHTIGIDDWQLAFRFKNKD